MRWSLRLFSLFGIPVFLHATFALILVFAGYYGLHAGGGLPMLAISLGLTVAVFFCVLLHEFGHALSARYYGIRTHDVTLTFIGGVARLERMPDKPWQEFVVALAGPMVNVLIAILLFFTGHFLFEGNYWLAFKASIADELLPLLDFVKNSLRLLVGQLSFADWKAWFANDSSYHSAQEILMENEGTLFQRLLLQGMSALLVANLMLVFFNLLPAFPMDGGRMFRALLAMRMGRVRATAVAARLGQFVAILFVALGLWQNIFSLLLIGFFVFTTARTELHFVRLDDMLSRFKATDLMRTQFTRLNTNDWMQTPIELLQHGMERHFLVFDLQEQLVGRLEEERVFSALKKKERSAEVSAYMVSEWESIAPETPLHDIYLLIRQKGHQILPVVDEKGVLGVVDEQGLTYFIYLQENA